MGMKCCTNGGEEECILVIGGKARRKTLLESPKRRWIDNTTLVLREIG
jgi:hypothetical protein